MKFRLRISSRTSGVPIDGLSATECLDIIAELIGKKGVTKLIIETDDSVPDFDELVEENIKGAKVAEAFSEAMSELLEEKEHIKGSIEANVLSEELEIEPFKSAGASRLDDFFHETSRIKLSDVGYEHHTPVPGLTYFSPGDDHLVIKHKTTKVHTTWTDIDKLECPLTGVQGPSLSPVKITAINKFLSWLNVNKDNAIMDPKDDPDKDFRPVLSQNTRISDDAGDLPGDMPEYSGD